MSGEAEAVVRHYGSRGIVGRLLDGVRARGGDPERLRAADLRGMDQLHGGGFAATEAMAEMARVTPGMYVLDAGCGLGGTSRYLAETFGVRALGDMLAERFEIEHVFIELSNPV